MDAKFKSRILRTLIGSSFAERTTEGAIKVAVHRLRERYRELIRAEIAETVEGDEQVDAELQELQAALRG